MASRVIFLAIAAALISMPSAEAVDGVVSQALAGAPVTPFRGG